MSFPVEIAAVNDQAANRISVSAKIFRRRVHDDGCAVLKRSHEIGRRGVVDDERNAERSAYRRHFGNGKDRQLWIRQRFGIVSAGRSSVARGKFSGSIGSTNRTSIP